MTGIYLSCKGKMLLLYRQNGRVVSDKWVASAGGHFEPDELNDPYACVLRELNEELGLSESDIEDLKSMNDIVYLHSFIFSNKMIIAR